MTHLDTSNDVPDRQAEFNREGQRLEDTLAYIDKRIAQIRNYRGGMPHFVGAADELKGYAILERLDPSRRQEWISQIAPSPEEAELRRIRPSPYFGRIDYADDENGEIKTAYIGHFSSGVSSTLDSLHPPVVDRNAPIASLYYDPSGSRLRLPGGIDRKAAVYLKRMLTIRQTALLNMEDVLRLAAPSDIPQLTSSETLDERLAGASEGELSDVVQTIQPEQYRAIAATTKPVLIVQGAAGSGKSLIGLHRMDYILSPHSDIGGWERPSVERIIMFGPSPAFLQYVSNLLPGLGVHGVRQSTVSQWLRDQFSARVTLSRNDRTFDDLMNNRRQLREAEINAHQFKGSLKMKRMLDNYARRTTQDLRRRIRSMHGGFPLGLSTTEFNRRVDAAFSARSQLNAARAYLVEILAAYWARNAERSRRPGRLARRGETRYDLIAEGRRQVENGLRFWQRLDFRREYVGLVSDPDKILEFARSGDLDLEDATEISQTTTATEAGQALGMTDLAAALYLDYALNGFQSQRFQHVVVDEAQDVSPLELELMRMHSTNDSFTILGDLRQSLLRFKSIKTWNELSRLFERDSVSRLDSRLTYRSTRQITQYANRILQGLPRRTEMPTPHRRNGDRPRLVRSKGASDMRLAIATEVQDLLQKGDVRSVAILTKWRRTSDDIGEVFAALKIPDVSVFRAGNLIETDIIISPIVLTKGLEFDAVIVANAGKNNFNETDFDRMLLYLACTRAKHHLQIHWYGSRSPIVPGVERIVR